jgi:RecA-family ATPase
VTPGERYDYAAELARYPHSQIVRLLETAEDLQRDLEASGERWPNVDANAQRLRDELTRRGWRRSYSVWELLEVAPQPCVTVSRADLDAVLAGPGDGSWECSDARARIRTVLADLDRAAQSEVADRG